MPRRSRRLKENEEVKRVVSVPVRKKSRQSSSESLALALALALANLPILPTEIIEDDILPRLPPKPLVRFKCVSTSWRSLLSSNPFLDRYFGNHRDYFILEQKIRGCPTTQFYSTLSCQKPKQECSVMMDLPPFQLPSNVNIMSSNGLVCLADSSYSVIYIWNPATAEYKSVPCRQHPPQDPLQALAFGFGFSSQAKDYKIVIVSLQDEKNAKKRVDMYSLSTDKWTRVCDAPRHIFNGFSRVILNGAIHWSSCNSKTRNLVASIVSFNMANQNFRTLELPDNLIVSMRRVYSYTGCLSVLAVTPSGNLDVWVMMDYGSKASWNRLFAIQEPSGIRPSLTFSPTGQPVFESLNGDFLLHRSESGLITKVVFPGVAHICDSYTKNLASLGPWKKDEEDQLNDKGKKNNKGKNNKKRLI